jgi:hypothetical protein
MDAREEMPAAEDMLLVQDFEEWAQRVLSGTAWSYYRSAADEEHSESLPPITTTQDFVTSHTLLYSYNRVLSPWF